VEWCSWLAPCLGLGCGLGGDELLVAFEGKGDAGGVGGGGRLHASDYAALIGPCISPGKLISYQFATGGSTSYRT
jgi:hypothetical protein